MKILILGGDGMLGHQLLLTLRQNHQVKVTLHRQEDTYRRFGLFSKENSYFDIDIRNIYMLEAVINEFHPEIVINAIGLVKKSLPAHSTKAMIEVNALFPHRLAKLCAFINAYLIHFSTDCVFSGNKGHYTEEDISDANDVYGRCKFLGEIHTNNCLTIRTSFIGPELLRKNNLIEWFLAQKGIIKGYRKAIFSGFTTLETSYIIDHILQQKTRLTGIWHVASQPISKFDLLTALCTLLQRTDIQIQPDDIDAYDRSLISDGFNAKVHYPVPSWNHMLAALADQIKNYQI